MFEARWSAYVVETNDGRTLSGLIQSETPDTVVLAMMPDGLEAAITKEQMSGLLAFLRSAGAPTR
jgi:hypothetical protein